MNLCGDKYCSSINARFENSSRREEKNCGAYKSELKETDVEKRKLKKKVDLQNAFLIIL